MKFFGRTGGYWLFWWTTIYFLIGMADIFVLKVDWFPWVQLAWVCLCALPLFCNPLARWLNMKENTMFDWFKKKENSNVVPFPTPKAVPEIPKEEEKPATTYYRLGLTDNNRISLKMGYSEITMNYQGADNMIKQLELFRDQLQEANNESV